MKSVLLRSVAAPRRSPPLPQFKSPNEIELMQVANEATSLQKIFE
jgi:hypothetical protein